MHDPATKQFLADLQEMIQSRTAVLTSLRVAHALVADGKWDLSHPAIKELQAIVNGWKSHQKGSKH